MRNGYHCTLTGQIDLATCETPNFNVTEDDLRRGISHTHLVQICAASTN